MNRQPLVEHAYRRDIDGLRAIAILAVLIFHLDKHLLPGGFVGVDVFFVISGFLITQNIIAEIDKKRFSILEFYRRRIKRIAPPLMVVIAATLLAAHFLLVPEDLRNAAVSALFSLLSMANVYFWLFLDEGYFSTSTDQIPLLNLWSLGVEEQYYLLWPVVLMWLYSRVSIRRLLAWLVAITIFSYLLGDFLFERSPSFTYYMLPSRAGELMVGGLLAMGQKNALVPSPSYRVAWSAGVVGLGLVFASLLLLSEDSVFPGIRAIPATFGAALLIYSGSGKAITGVQRILSARPMVFIGLISYSAYLWHWPILAFLRYGYTTLTPWMQFGAAIATFALATMSFLYVETPLRRTQATILPVFVKQYAMPGALIGGVAILTIFSPGFTLHAPETQFDVLRPAYEYNYVCQDYLITQTDLENPDCIIGDSRGVTNDNMVLWGDSHAAHYIGVLGAFARREGYSFRNIAHSACPPLFVVPHKYVGAKNAEKCAQSLKNVEPLVRKSSVVVMAASWSSYQMHSRQFLVDLESTVRELARAGSRVVILGRVPSFPKYDRKCLQKSELYPFLSCAEMYEPKTQSVSEMNLALLEMTKSIPGASYYDVTEFLCEEKRCTPFASDNTPLYFDSAHLSMAGSWMLGEEIMSRSGVPSVFQRRLPAPQEGIRPAGSF